MKAYNVMKIEQDDYHLLSAELLKSFSSRDCASKYIDDVKADIESKTYNKVLLTIESAELLTYEEWKFPHLKEYI